MEQEKILVYALNGFQSKKIEEKIKSSDRTIKWVSDSMDLLTELFSFEYQIVIIQLCSNSTNPRLSLSTASCLGDPISIYHDDMTNFFLDDLEGLIKSLKEEFGFEVVVIDQICFPIGGEKLKELGANYSVDSVDKLHRLF